MRRHITVPMAPQAMARRMSTIAGMRSGEQLTSEDAVEATAGEKAEDATEATPDEKAEDAEATADEKAEATVVGRGTADAQLNGVVVRVRSLPVEHRTLRETAQVELDRHPLRTSQWVATHVLCRLPAILQPC